MALHAATPENVGKRIRAARERAEVTQDYIAKRLGMSRAGIAQWEGGVTSPSIEKVDQVAKLTGTTPQWLAYGIDGAPVIERKPPEGTVEVKEVVFGDKVADMQPTGSWSVPEAYLKGDLHVLSNEGLIIWRAESDTMSPAYEYGDRILIDTNAKRPSPPGMFLIWDGVGPALAQINVVQAAGNKQIARVNISASASADEGTSYSSPVDKLSIIGRVRGRVHAS